MTDQGLSNLFGCQYESAGRVQDEVKGQVLRCKAHGPEHLFRVVYVQVAGEGDTKEAHGFLAVDQSDDSRSPFFFETLYDEATARFLVSSL
jgi:hypothetical protein